MCQRVRQVEAIMISLSPRASRLFDIYTGLSDNPGRQHNKSMLHAPNTMYPIVNHTHV
jgi:hypothetical protein